MFYLKNKTTGETFCFNQGLYATGKYDKVRAVLEAQPDEPAKTEAPEAPAQSEAPAAKEPAKGRNQRTGK